LGNLLRAAGRTGEAEEYSRRAGLIWEQLYRANPDNVDATLGYASSLAVSGRWDEAEELVDEVLAAQPRHPFANRMKASFCSTRQGCFPSSFLRQIWKNIIASIRSQRGDSSPSS